MFSDNLPVSLLRLCDSYGLTYEAAAERCNISTRYFGSIARGKATPSIVTLEKLCIGFNATPNELLGVCAKHARVPMQVVEVRYFSGAMSGFPVCPQCGISLEREYQAFCDRCGQMLSWYNYHNAHVILPSK